jgi:hypothetical protein
LTNTNLLEIKTIYDRILPVAAAPHDAVQVVVVVVQLESSAGQESLAKSYVWQQDLYLAYFLQLKKGSVYEKNPYNFLGYKQWPKISFCREMQGCKKVVDQF